MNERIQQLALQAHVTVLTTKGMEDIVDGCYIISPDKLDKFAELIVKECAEVIDDGRFSFRECEGNSHRVSYNNGIYYALSSVKKHFGVEE